MSYLTQLRVRRSEGVLERVLGVARVRGFDVQAVSAQRDLHGSHFDLTLRVSGERSPQRLSRQLEKLLDVESVEIFRALSREEGGRDAGR